MFEKETKWMSVSFVIGMIALGAIVAKGLIAYKAMERVVTVKGLSERYYPADEVIWPIRYAFASNDLSQLHESLARQTLKVKAFLLEQGIQSSDITVASPNVVDRFAQRYANDEVKMRYQATQTMTVFSKDVARVRHASGQMTALLEQGIVIVEDTYQSQTTYAFTRLNEVKPEMIEEATINARLVAAKFAMDSGSEVGKIIRANQGRFEVYPRDSQHPHIMKVRVVSTIAYNLVD